MVPCIGWFLLLTSLLGYWRVKRWERSILSNATPAPAPTADSAAPSSSIFRAFGFHNSSLLRQGLIYPGSATRTTTLFDGDEEAEADQGTELLPGGELRGEYIIPVDETDPERTARFARAFADEARLQRDLRAAGLL